MTRASRESNPVPLDSESEGQPTRVVWHQKTASLRDLYGSKIWSDCVRARRGFFRTQNSDFVLFLRKKVRIFCGHARRGFIFLKKSGLGCEIEDRFERTPCLEHAQQSSGNDAWARCSEPPCPTHSGQDDGS